jgi:excisionase family DNA binding protein
VIGPVLLPAGGGVAVPAEHCAALLLLLRDAARAGRLTPELRALAEVCATAAAAHAGRRAGAAWATPSRVVAPAQMPSPSEETEIGTTEAANVLGVSSERVRQLAAAGRLPARRVGGRWLVNRADLSTTIRETK